MSVQTIHNSAEWKAAITSAGMVVIDCFGDGCGPCKKIAPKIEELAKSHRNTRFFKCNVYDEEMEAQAAGYDIQCVPTFLFFHQGRWLRDLTIREANLTAIRSSLQTLQNM